MAKSLKELDKFTNSFRFQRNTVAHKSSYSDEELHDLGSYYYVVEKDEQLEKYRHMFKRETDNYVAEKKAVFQKHVEELENLVEEVFNAVHKILRLD